MILAKIGLALLLCAMTACIIWQLPVHRVFKRVSNLGLTSAAFAATVTLVLGYTL